MRLKVPALLARSATGVSDPIAYYSRPGIGWLYRRRIEIGLKLLEGLAPIPRGLEIGYGAGVGLYNLAPLVEELHGIDLNADSAAVADRLRALGVEARLVQGSVVDMRDRYPDAYFDLVVSFSVLEHVSQPERALGEIARVLKPGGRAVIGMPAVNKLMEYAFRALGFKGIEDHHVTTPSEVWRLISARPTTWKARRRAMPSCTPLSLALYHVFALRRA